MIDVGLQRSKKLAKAEGEVPVVVYVFMSISVLPFMFLSLIFLRNHLTDSNGVFAFERRINGQYL